MRRCGLWGIAARIHLKPTALCQLVGCGLWGIAARIHYAQRTHAYAAAVACGESPLGYTPNRRRKDIDHAVACGESPLGYTGARLLVSITGAVACGESPLGYTSPKLARSRPTLWLVGNRRSDTLVFLRQTECLSCGLWGIAARIHFEGYGMYRRFRCGLWGIAARIHLSRRRSPDE